MKRDYRSLIAMKMPIFTIRERQKKSHFKPERKKTIIRSILPKVSLVSLQPTQKIENPMTLTPQVPKKKKEKPKKEEKPSSLIPMNPIPNKKVVEKFQFQTQNFISKKPIPKYNSESYQKIQIRNHFRKEPKFDIKSIIKRKENVISILKDTISTMTLHDLLEKDLKDFPKDRIESQIQKLELERMELETLESEKNKMELKSLQHDFKLEPLENGMELESFQQDFKLDDTTESMDLFLPSPIHSDVFESEYIHQTLVECCESFDPENSLDQFFCMENLF
jgi:hypothetical protein